MIIGNPIMAGGGGVTASIFVTGLSETDTVTATKGSKTQTGKWTQKPNPAAHGLPDGYTELEYIDSTGTQYIDTGITITQNIGVYLDFVLNNAISSSNVGSFFGGRDSTNSCWICSYNRYQTGSFDFGSTNYEAFLVSGKRMQLELKEQTYTTSEGGNISLPTTSFNTNLSAYLFAVNNMGTAHEYANLRLYSSKLYDGSTVVRNFIPAKRNSDSVIGLYDLVSGIFFENAGTGTFTAGAEVPQTIDGFLIKPIRDLGTWTVTATDGIQTETKDVLVDVITEYEIEMLYSKQYLYLNGDECEDITGGWEGIIYNGNHSYTIDPENGCMYLYSSSGSGNVRVFPSNKISTSGFSTLNFDIQPKTNASNAEINLGLSSQNTDWSIDSNVNIPANSNPGRVVKSLDISYLDAEYYLKIVVSGGECYVYGVWLEKEVNS